MRGTDFKSERGHIQKGKEGSLAEEKPIYFVESENQEPLEN